MKTIKIKRSKWCRGGKNGISLLLNGEHNMCCLGFAIHQVTRCKKTDLLGKAEPLNFFSENSFLTEVPHGDIIANNAFAYDAMEINDNHAIPESRREKELTKLFKKNGFNLVFED